MENNNFSIVNQYIVGKSKSPKFQELLNNNQFRIIGLDCCGASFFTGINMIGEIASFIINLEERKLFLDEAWRMINYVLEYYEVSILSCILAHYDVKTVVDMLLKNKPMEYWDLSIKYQEISENRNTGNILNYIHFITESGIGENDEDQDEEEYYEH